MKGGVLPCLTPLMENYGPSTYGDRIAEVYDELYGHMADVSGVVDLLAELADKGRALELGVGTGRVALPLAAAGKGPGSRRTQSWVPGSQSRSECGRWKSKPARTVATGQPSFGV